MKNLETEHTLRPIFYIAFASTVRINGLSNETISLCFDDIRQLLNLLLTKEWSLYLKDYGNASNKYNRVQAGTAAQKTRT